MERRILGRTGLQVSQLGYGAMEIRGRRPASDEQVKKYTSPKNWEKVLAVNLDGVMRCTRAALRPMMAARRGSIVTRSWSPFPARMVTINEERSTSLIRSRRHSRSRIPDISPSIWEWYGRNSGTERLFWFCPHYMIYYD